MIDESIIITIVSVSLEGKLITLNHCRGGRRQGHRQGQQQGQQQGQLHYTSPLLWVWVYPHLTPSVPPTLTTTYTQYLVHPPLPPITRQLVNYYSLFSCIKSILTKLNSKLMQYFHDFDFFFSFVWMDIKAMLCYAMYWTFFFYI